MSQKQTELELDELGLPYIRCYQGRARPWIPSWRDRYYGLDAYALRHAEERHEVYATHGFTRFRVGQRVNIVSDRNGQIALSTDGRVKEIWFVERHPWPEFVQYLWATYVVRVLVEGVVPASFFLYALDPEDAKGALAEFFSGEPILGVPDVRLYAPPGTSRLASFCVLEAKGPVGEDYTQSFLECFSRMSYPQKGGKSLSR